MIFGFQCSLIINVYFSKICVYLSVFLCAVEDFFIAMECQLKRFLFEVHGYAIDKIGLRCY